MREEILTSVNLTAEQRKKVDAIYKQYGDDPGAETARQRMEAIGRILTPAQRDEAANLINERIRKYIADRLKMLPPEEQKKFMQKLDKRFEVRRNEIERAIAAPTPTP